MQHTSSPPKELEGQLRASAVGAEAGAVAEDAARRAALAAPAPVTADKGRSGKVGVSGSRKDPFVIVGEGPSHAHGAARATGTAVAASPPSSPPPSAPPSVPASPQHRSEPHPAAPAATEVDDVRRQARPPQPHFAPAHAPASAPAPAPAVAPGARGGARGPGGGANLTVDTSITAPSPGASATASVASSSSRARSAAPNLSIFKSPMAKYRPVQKNRYDRERRGWQRPTEAAKGGGGDATEGGRYQERFQWPADIARWTKLNAMLQPQPR